VLLNIGYFLTERKNKKAFALFSNAQAKSCEKQHIAFCPSPLCYG